MTLRRFYPLGNNGDWPPLVNPSWEDDLTAWTASYTGGTGAWRIRTDKATDGGKAAYYTGAYTGGVGVQSLLENSASGDVVASTTGVTARVDISLDTPDDSQSVGEIRLYWLDAALAVISYTAGNRIAGDSRGRWFTSTVTGFAPALATSCKLRVWTSANEHGGVLVDNASWSKLE